MATWDITVSAGSTVGSGTDVLLTTISGVVPGDFDGSTIDSVAVQGTPTVTSDGTTDDTIEVRFFVTTTVPADVYGGDGSNAASMCFASVGDSASSANITDGSSTSPAPTTAVAADWDEVRYSIAYAANMKNDGETVSWSSFTVRVTYTPQVLSGSGSPNLPQLTASGVGERIIPGSGTPNLPQFTAVGVADPAAVNESGSGAPNLPQFTSSGVGVREVKGSGTPSLPQFTGNGAGSVLGAITGTGTPSIPQFTTVGVGERIIPGSGAPALPQFTAVGVGEREVTGVGAATLPQFTAVGVTEREFPSSGTPSLPQFTASGVGTINGAEPPVSTLKKRPGVGMRIGGAGM